MGQASPETAAGVVRTGAGWAGTGDKLATPGILSLLPTSRQGSQ